MLHPQTVLLPDGRHAVWISEDGGTCPETVAYVDDALSAKQAARQLRDGVFLVWTGDFHQARTLMKAIQRRIRPREDGAQTSASRWLAQRRLHTQAEITGRFLILIEPMVLSSTRTTSSRGDDLGVGPIGTGPIGALSNACGRTGCGGMAPRRHSCRGSVCTDYTALWCVYTHATRLSVFIRCMGRCAWMSRIGCRLWNGRIVLLVIVSWCSVCSSDRPRSTLGSVRERKCGITRVFQAIYSNRDRFISGQRV